jgi:hypothetical protein
MKPLEYYEGRPATWWSAEVKKDLRESRARLAMHDRSWERPPHWPVRGDVKRGALYAVNDAGELEAAKGPVIDGIPYGFAEIPTPTLGVVVQGRYGCACGWSHEGAPCLLGCLPPLGLPSPPDHLRVLAEMIGNIT